MWREVPVLGGPRLLTTYATQADLDGLAVGVSIGRSVEREIGPVRLRDD